MCPGAGNKLNFELNSILLGKSLKTFDFATPANSVGSKKNVTVFNFQGRVNLDDVIENRNKTSFKLPTLRIASIDPKGVLTIAFSENFFVIQNIT
jgi:hypothetical protein